MHHIKLNIYRQNLLENILRIKAKIGQDRKLIACAKGNCLGLQAQLVAPILAEHADYLATATIFEAMEIRQLCPLAKIMIFSEPRVSDFKILADHAIESCF